MKTLLSLGLAALTVLPALPEAQGSMVNRPGENLQDVTRYRRLYRMNRYEALEAAASRNELCKTNGLSSVKFKGLTNFTTNQDYCQLADGSVPANVVELLNRIGGIHRQMAQVLGQTWEQTVGLGIQISFESNAQGVLGSFATENGLTMTAYPDWTVQDFSSMVYAHELVHVLTFNQGELAKTLEGLQEHPYLVEALPDLISATIHGTPKMKINDPGLASCIMDFRDETPVKSLGMEFGHFYMFGSFDDMYACCQSVPTAQQSARTKGICGSMDPAIRARTYEQMAAAGIQIHKPTPADLAAPFEAKKCEVNIKGYDTMEGCDTHQYGHPLTSFFFTLQEKLGRSFTTEFLKTLKSQVANKTSYRCVFSNALPGETSSAQVSVRGVLQALVALRDSFSGAEQTLFDEAWASHDMGRIFELDSIYLEKSYRFEGMKNLVMANILYAWSNGCGSMSGFGTAQCDVKCTAL